MFTTLFFVALFVALFQTVFAQGSSFTIDTPTFVQCKPVHLTWSDTRNAPYDLLVLSAQDMCGPALEDLGNQTSTALTWTVNIASGTQVILSLLDSVGNEAWSGTITVGDSNDTTCLANIPPSTTPTVFGAGTHVPSLDGPSSTRTSSPSAVAGAANAGLGSPSGAPTTRPLRATVLVISILLAVVSAL